MECACDIDASGCHSWFPDWNCGHVNVAFCTDGCIDFFDNLVGRTVLGTVT